MLSAESSPASSPALTPAASPSRRKSRSPLSIDLSAIPPLTLPTPPSNTLIITNLTNKDIFRPDNLQTIRDLVASTIAPAPLHSWAPLRSFSRIIVSFYDVDAALRIKQLLDGEAIMGERVKVYFGAHTNIQPRDEHLNLPDAGKLFFISPPPSPPLGWEVKMEDAPNKMVHADDLAEALAKLRGAGAGAGAGIGNISGNDALASPASDTARNGYGRTRSSSTTIYDPCEHGGSPGLPAISVSVEDVDELSPVDMMMDIDRPILAHTSRPPVELMG